MSQQKPHKRLTKAPKRLTFNEAEIVNQKAQGKTHKEAYKKAYNPPETTKDSTIDANTRKILGRPHVQEALQAALKKHDITINNTLAPIGKALKATKKQYNHLGKEVGETEDLELQLKGSDRATKLLGINQENTSIHLHKHLHSKGEGYNL